MKMNNFFSTALLTASLITASIAVAETFIDDYLKKEYPHAMVSVSGNTESCQSGKIIPAGVSKLLVECENGERLLLNLTGKISVLVPKMRIAPMQTLNEGQFEKQEIDLFHPSVYPYRHQLITEMEKLSNMESRQTLLMGQPLLSPQLSECPIVRLGESVPVRIRVGDLVIQTVGIAQEKGVKNALIRVLTKSTKKDLVGKILEDRTVEVNL